MKKGSLFGSRAVLRLLAIAVLCTWLPGGVALGQIVVPPPDLNPLNQTPVPQPPNVYQYVTNTFAAIQLGKAFYWDMQAGSDGLTACATCHFSAGADNRRKNTLNPGTRGNDTLFGNSSVAGVPGFPQFAPNYTLQDSDFPLHVRGGNGHSQLDPLLRDTNDIVGSQGVRLSDFVGIEIINGVAVEHTTPALDPIFNLDYPSASDPARNLRQVTARNTPTVINAIYNFNNFWDGRASFIFNGENPFGHAAQDGQNPTSAAGVWLNEAGTLVKRPIALQFAGAASQAVGPPLDSIEMSARGRIFPDIGRKLLNSTPLGKQLVSHDDSILGGLAKSSIIPGAKGLHSPYSELIKAAFHDFLWDSPDMVTILRPNNQPAQFTQMEANFAFFWGLSIQFYLATLISDQTPYDHWLGGDATAMTDEQKQGFALFNGNAKCNLCHIGIELTAASHSSALYVNEFIHGLIELMFVADGTQVIYDNGFNNTAVSKTTQDIGRGGTVPFANPLNSDQPYPLSFSWLAELRAQNKLPFSTPIMAPFLPINMPVNADGAFKVPGLRNVALTAPYFHNGSCFTLDDVLDLYIRGGNFPVDNLHDMDSDVHAGLSPLIGEPANEHALISFMEALTDPRVIAESAPFDHPELFVPEGDPEVLIHIPATDFSGAPFQTSLSFNPFTTPTNVATQLISGTVEGGAPVEVTVNGNSPIPATVTGINWSVTITGLAEGVNTITARAVIDSVLTTATAAITLDTVAPALGMNAVASPTWSTVQAISGTVETGLTPVVTVAFPVTAGPVVVTGGTNWSFLVSNLQEGANTINISVTDRASNTTTLPPAVIVVDTIQPALTMNPVTSPTMLTTQTLSGFVEAAAVVRVSLNGGVSAPATVTGTGWSFVASPLNVGLNTISVTATDAASNTAVLPTATITVTVNVPHGVIAVSPASVDMGEVNVGSEKSRKVTVTNAGSTALVIGQITFAHLLPHNFTLKEDLCSNGSLAQAESCTVKVEFEPASAGLQNASLSIPSNDPETPMAGVPLSGSGSLAPVFNDVPEGSFAENFINALFYAGISGGCGGGDFCPNAPITRKEMAVFIETSLGNQPNACTDQFSDSTAAKVGSVFCGFIEKLAADGITAGCGGDKFCPEDVVSRAQMAVFIEAALGNPPNACTGVFADANAAKVGATVCGFIERLTADGITAGCGGGNFCPNDPVTRAQMAVFLVAAPSPLNP